MIISVSILPVTPQKGHKVTNVTSPVCGRKKRIGSATVILVSCGRWPCPFSFFWLFLFLAPSKHMEDPKKHHFLTLGCKQRAKILCFQEVERLIVTEATQLHLSPT